MLRPLAIYQNDPTGELEHDQAAIGKISVPGEKIGISSAAKRHV